MYVYRFCENKNTCEKICKNCFLNYWDCKEFFEFKNVKSKSLMFKCLKCGKYRG